MKDKSVLTGIILLVLLLSILSTNTVRAQDTEPTPTATATPVLAELIFSNEPGPDTPRLQEVAAGATTDDEILQAVVDYYEANQEQLSMLWREENPTRLAGLFSMYVVHISTIYGETEFPSTLVEYLGQQYAQCGTYTWMQFHIADALGLTYRTTEFVGEHAWLEIQVDGQWEIFDATTNTWLSRGVDELMQGLPRTYRQLYTPLLDIDRPDARSHMALGYDMQRLRQRMPTMGIVYMPPGELKVSEAVYG